MPPKDSKFSRADGWSKEPLPGSGDAAGSPRTSRRQLPAPSHGFLSPTSATSRDASQELEITGRVLSQTLRLKGKRRRLLRRQYHHDLTAFEACILLDLGERGHV